MWKHKKRIGFLIGVFCAMGKISFVYAAGDFVIFAHPVQYESAQVATVKISGVFTTPTADDQLIFNIPKTIPSALSLSLATSSATSSAVLTVKSTFGNLSSLYIPVTATDKNSAISHTVSVKIDASQSVQSTNLSASDFLLVATPTTIISSSSAPFSFSVTAFGEANATGTIKLSLSPSPILEKETLSPTAIAIGASSTVSGVVKTGTSPGIYLVKVTGRNPSGITHTATVTIQVPGAVVYSGSFYTLQGSLNSGITTIQNNENGKSVAINTGQNQEVKKENEKKETPAFIPPTVSCQKNIFTLYAPSPESIDATLALAKSGDVVLIQPTALGIDEAQDATLALTVAKLQNRGVSVFGIVDGLYGFTTANNIENEIKKYKSQYAVDGIAIKNISTVADSAQFFNAVATTIKNTYGLKSAFIFSGYTNKAYYNSVIDYAVFNHGTLEEASTVPSKEFFDYPAEKRINIVRGITDAELVKKAVHASRFTSVIGVTPATTIDMRVSQEIGLMLQNDIAGRCASQSVQPVNQQSTGGNFQLLRQLQELLANLLKRVTG